jgi:hypothetical protein
MSLSQKCAPVRLGIDLDNTLISYDALFMHAASERGWLTDARPSSKKVVRDAVRALPDGEVRWQILQAEVYGRRMAEACLIDGAATFLQTCRARHMRVCIVSHKTRYARRDPNGVDLRQAARAWLVRHGFFDPDGFGLSPDDLFFEATRREKIERIRSLGCSHFVDDLEEIFLDTSFPPDVIRYLIHTGEELLPKGPFKAFASWADISVALFGQSDVWP